MTEDQFYGIWNRACIENGGAEPLEGDVALTRMLLGHGQIMNGGLDASPELSEEEQHKSIGGYRFFSFNDVPDLILRTPGLSEDELDDAHNSYREFDTVMLDKIRSYIDANPSQFRSP